MKLLKLTLIFLFLLSYNSYAQSFDRIIISSYNEGVVSIDNKKVSYKQHELNEENTPIRFNPADKYKLNQNTIWSPTSVNKKLKVDFNGDGLYDKKATVAYIKIRNVGLNFILLPNGVNVGTDNKNVTVKTIVSNNRNVTDNIINKNGTFTLKLSNGRKTIITVSDYNIIK
jgi:hypothetical protein